MDKTNVVCVYSQTRLKGYNLNAFKGMINLKQFCEVSIINSNTVKSTVTAVNAFFCPVLLVICLILCIVFSLRHMVPEE